MADNDNICFASFDKPRDSVLFEFTKQYIVYRLSWVLTINRVPSTIALRMPVCNSILDKTIFAVFHVLVKKIQNRHETKNTFELFVFFKKMYYVKTYFITKKNI